MKGQTAMEYLIVYGWALIIVLVIMAILYATIFKPEFYIIEKCDTSPDIECVPGMVKLAVKDVGTELIFDLVNSMGYDIQLLNVSFYPEGITSNVYSITPGVGGFRCDCYTDRPGGCFCLQRMGEGLNMKNGETKRFGVMMYDVKADADRIYKIKFVINYNITTTGTLHKTAGVINVRATRE